MSGQDGNDLRGMSAANALAAVANQADLDALSYDADISTIDKSDWKWMEECCEVDRVSLWALDSFGRTRFQMHGLQMCNPRFRRRRDHETSRHATGINSKVSVHFTPGHLRLTFLDTSI